MCDFMNFVLLTKTFTTFVVSITTLVRIATSLVRHKSRGRSLPRNKGRAVARPFSTRAVRRRLSLEQL